MVPESKASLCLSLACARCTSLSQAAPSPALAPPSCSPQAARLHRFAHAPAVCGLLPQRRRRVCGIACRPGERAALGTALLICTVSRTCGLYHVLHLLLPGCKGRQGKLLVHCSGAATSDQPRLLDQVFKTERDPDVVLLRGTACMPDVVRQVLAPPLPAGGGLAAAAGTAGRRLLCAAGRYSGGTAAGWLPDLGWGELCESQ